MENLIIQKFQDPDSQAVGQLFEDFIDYIIAIDPMKIVWKQSDYGQNYLKKIIKDVNDKRGIFLVAKINKQTVGLGVAVIEKLSPEDLMEVPEHTPGRVMELYVDKNYRKQGIGTELMQKLESYLKEQGCDTLHIGVFAPNYLTHKLYKRLGYIDRNIDMVKVLNTNWIV